MTQISLSYMSPTILCVKTRRRMAYAKSLPYIFTVLLVVLNGVALHCSSYELIRQRGNGNNMSQHASNSCIKLEREKIKLMRYELHHAYLQRYKELNLTPKGLSLKRNLEMQNTDVHLQSQWDNVLQTASAQLCDTALKWLERTLFLLKITSRDSNLNFILILIMHLNTIYIWIISIKQSWWKERNSVMLRTKSLLLWLRQNNDHVIYPIYILLTSVMMHLKRSHPVVFILLTLPLLIVPSILLKLQMMTL